MRSSNWFLLAPALVAVSCVLANAQEFRGGAHLDAIIEQAIADDQAPGAVVVVGHAGRIVYQKAYGKRQLTPTPEPMTLDTIFDVASLTKVVATTSCVMKLVEEGKLRLNDPVTRYLSEYQGGKSDITVRQLLTHFSGLRPDVDLRPEWSGYETGIQKALIDKPVAPPNTKFVYSDINFILLGEIVRRLGGKPLPDYAKEKIFDPLGMTETTYRPPESWRARIAPTEFAGPGQPPLRGVVHDETTRFMGGIAGHAGLFSTAADLAKFAEMMLGRGSRQGVHIFSPLAVRTFTSPQSPAGQAVLRGLGWDIDSPYSSNRGDLFPIGSYGHTGFTGTSLWIDPHTDSYVILLANSVHPKRRPAISSLRSRVASAAAAGLGVDAAVPAAAGLRSAAAMPADSAGGPERVVETGLDVAAADGFRLFRGKRVGLITNHTGISRHGKRNLDLMTAAGVAVKAVFSPEHGIAGKEDHENIGNTRDAATGVPVFSLYSGPNRRPSAEMLKDIDVLVFDIQDIGTRFYTYSCTMLNSMEEAGKRKIPFVVLDRPNPINGLSVEGPLIEAELKSFVGCLDVPLRHGMTLGELARMANDKLAEKAELTVVPVRNWRREDWFDQTGLPWVNPSPNMRSLTAALLYPGIGMLEYAKNYSVGRGTETPFEVVGADWIKGGELANYLNNRGIAGARAYPVVLEPSASHFAGKRIEGVRILVTDRNALSSFRFGLELACALQRLYPGKMSWQVNEKLIGSREMGKAIASGEEPASIHRKLEGKLEEFRRNRSQYLLY